MRHYGDTAVGCLVAVIVIVAVVWIVYAWGLGRDDGRRSRREKRQRICACSVTIRESRCPKKPSFRTNGSAQIGGNLCVNGNLYVDGEVCFKSSMKIGRSLDVSETVAAKDLALPAQSNLLVSSDAPTGTGVHGVPSTVYHIFKSFVAGTGVLELTIPSSALVGPTAPMNTAPNYVPVLAAPKPGFVYIIDEAIMNLRMPAGGTSLVANNSALPLPAGLPPVPNFFWLSNGVLLPQQSLSLGAAPNGMLDLGPASPTGNAISTLLTNTTAPAPTSTLSAYFPAADAQNALISASAAQYGVVFANGTASAVAGSFYTAGAGLPPSLYFVIKWTLIKVE